ncbi:DUF3575 domain-containing protein [Pseudobacteriovorax antillogorgiicola]|uniref:Outer membrane protein beta-barrel domain-containing protein n=1 Tax=Pseudobacteriovorax antillogorgiicola TaxID=1513793 RepID=A0A1Y6CGM4_9BACT|nr:DUF3575 domain-containing protein [Pseudobacteriovorax antillogorgiicola]TCS47576.1 uncharacterized protein DUF3575 [Pseudobacteriovorax antillogorgiicola]SMF60420.1 Protein of unknown function [Pseudobacteriovorax antillogorgiicola]
MKIKTLALAGLLSLLASSTSFATEKTYNIKTDPLSLALGVPNIGVVFQLSENVGMGVSGSMSRLRWDDDDITAVGANLEAGYYFSGVFEDTGYLKAFTGLATVTSSHDDIGSTVANVGVIGGYQWMWENFNTSVGGGVQYIQSEGLSIGLPALEWTIGYAI